MNLSPGAEAAWMIAAGEAAAAGHDLIEPAHLLIGTLSLGKLAAGVAPSELGTNAALVRDENARLLKALSSCGVEATRLRRRARMQLGRGPLQGPPKGPLSRSLTCKAVFAAAGDLAGAGQGIGVAHLIAALAEDVDVVTSRIIRSAGAEPAKLRAALRELRPGLESARGVSIADETLEAAIDLSMRFEGDRKLPDKAIELVEKAARRASPSSRQRGGEAPLVTPLLVARVIAELRSLPLDVVTETL